MKKIVVTGKEPERELVAVVTEDGDGIFLRRRCGGTVLFSLGAKTATAYTSSLDTVAAGPKRMRVYEGDTVTIHF